MGSCESRGKPPMKPAKNLITSKGQKLMKGSKEVKRPLPKGVEK